VRERHLRWDGCVNVRDLGGLPTEDGAETAYGAVVRADNLTRLSDAGWDDLAEYGVQRIVDLRWSDERRSDPLHRAGIDVVHVSLFGDRSGPLEGERAIEDDADWAAVRRSVYLDRLADHPDRFALAVRAVGDAADVCVAVHCAGGVDRTGLISALLLRLAGVSASAIAHDYARSELNWSPYSGTWIDEAEEERERQRRRFLATMPPSTMLGVLEWLDEEHGGAAGYLRTAGLSEHELERARTKLRP
jgi:protein-tyrosine phosphatase